MWLGQGQRGDRKRSISAILLIEYAVSLEFYMNFDSDIAKLVKSGGNRASWIFGLHFVTLVTVFKYHT